MPSSGTKYGVSIQSRRRADGERREDPFVDGTRFLVRPGGGDLEGAPGRGAVLEPARRREKIPRGIRLLRRERPVVEEQRLQIGQGGSIDHRGDVSPLFLRRSRSHVLPSDVHSSRERFPSVRDQQFPMVPQVGGPPAVEGECRHEGRHLPARLPQRPHGSSQRPPRPHGIEQQPDADPFPRPRGERLDEPAPDGVDVEDEKLRVQMVTGGSDQGEDGLVCLVPAAKEGDAVPFRRWRRSRREEDPAAPLPDVGGELLGPKPVGEGRGDRPDGGDLGADVPADPAGRRSGNRGGCRSAAGARCRASTPGSPKGGAARG